MAVFSSSSIDLLATTIMEYITEDEFSDIYDDVAMAGLTLEEREANDSAVIYGPMMHAVVARALLRAAEQQLILAMGGAEDVTPSAVSIGG